MYTSYDNQPIWLNLSHKNTPALNQAVQTSLVNKKID